MRARWSCVVVLVLGCSNSGTNHLADAPPVDSAPACVLTGPPIATHAGTITADETWASGIHAVTATVTVTGGTLTIAPCAEIQLAPDASIEVQPGGTALVAEGTATQPIRFVRATAAQPWGHLFAFTPARMSLAYATLTGGGTAGTYQTADQLGAALAVRGGATLPQMLHVDGDVTGASGIAVLMNGARFTTGSTALTISGAGFFPILLGADSANELPYGGVHRQPDRRYPAAELGHVRGARIRGGRYSPT